MLSRTAFLVSYAIVHSVATIVMLQNFVFNSGGPTFLQDVLRVLGFLLTLPLLAVFILFDPDGDSFPRWFQFLTVFLNGLIWGMGIDRTASRETQDEQSIPLGE